MLNEGREFLSSAWWISTFPVLAITWLVLGINLVGQGLADRLSAFNRL